MATTNDKKETVVPVLRPSSSQNISMASSADGSPLREENFVHSLKSQVDGENIEEIIQSQKKALERFEKTNEMLTTCALLAEKRLERAKKDFSAGKEKICRAKSDLDSIFRRIATFKQTLADNYPAEFDAAQSDHFTLKSQKSLIPILFNKTTIALTNTKSKRMPENMRGTHFLAGSVLFSTVTISWVLWDNKKQEQKRTSSVRSILASAQRQKNMEEYVEQQKLYKQYKMSIADDKK